MDQNDRPDDAAATQKPTLHLTTPSTPDAADADPPAQVRVPLLRLPVVTELQESPSTAPEPPHLRFTALVDPEQNPADVAPPGEFWTDDQALDGMARKAGECGEPLLAAILATARDSAQAHRRLHAQPLRISRAEELDAVQVTPKEVIAAPWRRQPPAQWKVTAAGVMLMASLIGGWAWLTRDFSLPTRAVADSSAFTAAINPQAAPVTPVAELATKAQPVVTAPVLPAAQLSEVTPSAAAPAPAPVAETPETPETPAAAVEAAPVVVAPAAPESVESAAPPAAPRAADDMAAALDPLGMEFDYDAIDPADMWLQEAMEWDAGHAMDAPAAAAMTEQQDASEAIAPEVIASEAAALETEMETETEASAPVPAMDAVDAEPTVMEAPAAEPIAAEAATVEGEKEAPAEPSASATPTAAPTSAAASPAVEMAPVPAPAPSAAWVDPALRHGWDATE